MISVIIPVYNNYTTLGACLASVFAQSFDDIEVIVVDDGSDNVEKIAAIVQQYPVNYFIQQHNQGAPKARNVGFEQSSGSCVIFVDSDVVLNKQCLERMYEVLTASQADFCYSGFKFGFKKHAMVPFSFSTLREYNYIHTTSLLRRASFPGFDESLSRFQDWDLWLTICANGGTGKGIDEVLYSVATQHNTMSSWLPKVAYQLPWPILGYEPKQIKEYKAAQCIITTKHTII